MHKTAATSIAGKRSNFTTSCCSWRTGLRPDEAKNLQHRDVAIVQDEATGETILEIEVRGKRGVGYCKSMPGAVRAYRRLLKRPRVLGPSQTPRARLERGEDPAQPAPETIVKLP